MAALQYPMSVIADHVDVPLCTLAKMSWSFDACFCAHLEEIQKQAEVKGPKLASSLEYGPSPTTKPTKSQIADIEKKTLDLC